MNTRSTPAKPLGLALCLALGCADAPEDAPAGPGGDAKTAAAPDFRAAKADGRLAPRHLGVLEPGATQVRMDEGPVSFRVRTFPGTRLRLRVSAPEGDLDPVLAVRGPIPAEPEALFAYNDDADASTFDAALEVTHDGLGAFEVVVGTYGQYHLEQSTPGRLQVQLECLAGCALPQITLEALLAQFEPGAVQTALGQVIPALFPDPDTAAAVGAQASATLSGAATGPFPRVPLAAVGTAQALLESPGAPVAAPAPVTFDLGALQARDCAVERGRPAPIHPALPAALVRGGWPDYGRDDCAIRRARSFAEVLNNLALDNGSKVVAGAVEYRSVEDVAVGLIDAGHRITLTNDRYFANFLSLSFGGAAVVAPVWIDTGLPLQGGDTLAIPAPHSHWTIRVRGPLLDADLEYYMGTGGGVSFRPMEHLKPEWTGERTAATYDSAQDPDAVVRLLTLAGRLWREWTERGASLPLLGYGQLGVCNDSTALLELGESDTVTLYPLANNGPTGAGGLIDQLLTRLPRDTAGPTDPADTWRRLLATLPYTGAPLPQLEAQLNRR